MVFQSFKKRPGAGLSMDQKNNSNEKRSEGSSQIDVTSLGVEISEPELEEVPYIFIPSAKDFEIYKKLVYAFGEEKAKFIMKLVREFVVRRLSSIIKFAEHVLSDIHLTGIKIDVITEREYGETDFRVTFKIDVTDIDPDTIKKTLRILRRFAKMHDLKKEKIFAALLSTYEERQDVMKD